MAQYDKPKVTIDLEEYLFLKERVDITPKLKEISIKLDPVRGGYGMYVISNRGETVEIIELGHLNSSVFTSEQLKHYKLYIGSKDDSKGETKTTS